MHVKVFKANDLNHGKLLSFLEIIESKNEFENQRF